MKSCAESTFYMCLSYCQLKKFDILNLEVNKSQDQCVRLVGLLANYINEAGQRGAIIEKLDSIVGEHSSQWTTTKDTDSDYASADLCCLLVSSSIYVREKMFAKALSLLHKVEALPAYLARVGIYLLMNRVDLAESELKKMQTKDDFSTMTTLAVIQVRLATNAGREAHDLARELEEKYKATPLLLNLQTVAAISMGNYDLAKDYCESSLDLDNDNLEALINMVHISSKLRASSEVKERHFNRLKALYAEHEFVKEIDRLEKELVPAV